VAVSAYSDEVVTDSPLVYYPDASAAPWADDIGSSDIAITGATANVTGPLAFNDTKAFSFDGTDDFGQVALDLTGTSTVTVEFILWWDAFANNDDLCLEFGTTLGVGGFQVNPNSSGALDFVAACRGNIGVNGKEFVRPSAAAWHHYAFIFDFTQAAADEVTGYIDGTLASGTASGGSANNTAAFASTTLNLMSRNAASLFGAGDLAHLAIYTSALSGARITAHFDAIDDDVVADPPSLYLVRSGLRLA
jgi:hypothetical protein